MKYARSKEWTLRMAAIEEECDCPISAGLPIFYPPSITGWTPPVDKPKRVRKTKTSAASSTPKPVRKRRVTATKSRG